MLQEYHRARPWPTAPCPHRSRAYNAQLRLAERPANPAWRPVAKSGQDFSVRVGRGRRWVDGALPGCLGVAVRPVNTWLYAVGQGVLDGWPAGAVTAELVP